MTFPYVQGFDRAALILKTERIRDEISMGINNDADLVVAADATFVPVSQRAF